MKETGNIFDASTTLMEIEDLPESEDGPRPEDKPVYEAESEPDYFASAPSKGSGDTRRRALAVLGVVGGMVFTVVLVSAATGMGDDGSSPPPVNIAQPEKLNAIPTGEDPAASEGSATVVGGRQAPPPESRAEEEAAQAAKVRAKARSERRQAKAKAAAAREKRQHKADPPSTAPPAEPEATYTPEPETTYVPEAAPPPAPAPSPSPAPASPQEFGIEP